MKYKLVQKITMKEDKVYKTLELVFYNEDGTLAFKTIVKPAFEMTSKQYAKYMFLCSQINESEVK